MLFFPAFFADDKKFLARARQRDIEKPQRLFFLAPLFLDLKASHRGIGLAAFR